jgi:glycosyltransferase involved in cell wall biosynthesis
MKISIIMASYNYATYIQQAIDSIINQTYSDWELIIVDDGSTDNSIDIIKSYTEKYKNILFYQHEKGINKGLSETLQFGLKNATGEYIAFLESDDYWSENHLEEKVNVINNNPEVKFVFNPTELFGDEEVIKDHLNNTSDNPPIEEKTDSYNYMPFSFLEMSVVGTFSSMMISKEILINCSFNTPYGPYLDWWLCHQIAIRHKMYYLNKKLTFWRLHKKSYTNEKYEKQNQKKIDNYYRKLYQSYILNLNSLKIKFSYKITILFFLCLKWLAVPQKLNKIFRGIINKLKKTLSVFK